MYPPEADIYPSDFMPAPPTEEQAFELWLDEVGRPFLADLLNEIEGN